MITRRLLIVLWFALLWCSATAQSDHEPLYIVNGEVRSSVSDIPEKNIEKIETLPADEQTVQQYGDKANNGVVIITLCYDKAAIFPLSTTFSEYISSQIKWTTNDPVARFVMRFTVNTDGTLTAGNILHRQPLCQANSLCLQAGAAVAGSNQAGSSGRERTSACCTTPEGQEASS